MKIGEPDAATILQAVQGSLEAVDRIITTVQPGIYRLAVHVLGHREDAADATQEVLLKLITHLGSFRGDARFSTWAWRVACNHLMTARTRRAESPEVSLEAMAERLDQGLEFATHLAHARGEPAPLTPEDKLEARQLALACTQSMLMALDREQRLVYVIDTVFDLDSEEAAAIVGVTAPAYRQRLSRARARLQSFMARSCGLCNPQAACRCERQLPAMRHLARTRGPDAGAVVALGQRELSQAQQAFDAFGRVCDAAAVFRAHPDYAAPERMRSAIRAVLTQEGFMSAGPLQ
jgi:RNA polymerase sigma factor (sigma-70 family)